MWQNKNHTPNFYCFGNRDMFNKYINQLVVCWFTKYILTESTKATWIKKLEIEDLQHIFINKNEYHLKVKTF